jgi:hypothetical protein
MVRRPLLAKTAASRHRLTAKLPPQARARLRILPSFQRDALQIGIKPCARYHLAF